MPGGRAERSALPKGSSGRPLCRWCALEVPTRRFTFCSEWCVHEWRLRSSPAYLRQQVLRRDQGICAICSTNTISAFLRLKKARGTSRQSMLEAWGLTRMTRRSLWDADHILAVVEGGGECDLQNIRTLCLRCHKQETLRLRARLIEQRRSKVGASMQPASI